MKDLVEHIRTIHFTVLAVTLAITAAMQLQKEKSLEQAASDAQVILRLSEDWNKTTASLTTDLDRSFREQAGGQTQEFVTSPGTVTLPPVGKYEVFVVRHLGDTLYGKQLQM